jgi:predicted transglutaminase-like cysteine proteinase
MSKSFAGIAAGAIFAAANICAAAASPAAAPMREGGYALAPFSFVKFCIDYPGECPKEAGPARIRLTHRRMAELSNVNSEVNDAIAPTPDTSALRYWKLDVDAGDCNAFAVQKRHELIERGWPAAALALTVVKTSWGEGHLVVTVRTDRGDLVLDNLRLNIVPWQRAGYHWIMRQSERDPQYWVELHGGRPGPMKAAMDLDDATAVAERAADAGRMDNLANASSSHADAPEASNAQVLETDAVSAALDEAKASAAGASIADLAQWIADNRDAFIPAFYDAADALDRMVDASWAIPAKLATNRGEEAEVVDPTRFGFI